MQERMHRADPVRPETPSRAGWVLDPWGDGERFWDGDIWTRQTRELGSVEAKADALAAETTPDPSETEAPSAQVPTGPRNFELLEEDTDDDRPFRSGLLRGMIWAFAVVAIIAMLLTAVSIWPMLLRETPNDRQVTIVPQQSAQRA